VDEAERPGQARFLSRQLSLPVSTMSQWWVRRLSSAVVILASPKTVGLRDVQPAVLGLPLVGGMT
jgi:hypothetical protein